MSERMVENVIERIMRASHAASMAQRDDMRPKLIVFSRKGWCAFRADPAIVVHGSPTGRLEDHPFCGCKIEIDPKAQKPFRVLSERAAQERAEARAHRRII